MTTQTPTSGVETMHRLYQAFERGDLDTVRAALHPDFVMRQTERLPWGGEHRGPDGFFAFLGTLFSHVETRVEIEDVYDSGEHVVQVGWTDGHAVTTGRPFRIREVHVWTLRDGLVAGWQVHIDVDSMLAAIS